MFNSYALVITIGFAFILSSVYFYYTYRHVRFYYDNEIENN